MIIIENFNNCKQKYGEVLPRNFLEAGLPDMYLNSACRFHTESRISINNLIYLFKEWNKYVRNYDQIDVNSLSYEAFRQHIAQAKLKHCLPNTIIVTNNAALGRLDNVKDARNIPVESYWCIKARNKFDEYIQKGGELYAIYLPSESAPFTFNIALIIGGNVIYYNSNNLRQNENWANPNESEHQVFQNKLPSEITNYLYNRAADQTDKRLNCNKNMNRNRKNVVRLTESKLCVMIQEAVKEALSENSKQYEQSQGYLDFLEEEGYTDEAIHKVAKDMAENGIESLKDGNREVLCIAFDQNDNLMYSLHQRGWRYVR